MVEGDGGLRSVAKELLFEHICCFDRSERERVQDDESITDCKQATVSKD